MNATFGVLAKRRPSWPTPAALLGELADQLYDHSLEVVIYQRHFQVVAVTVCWPSQRDRAVTIISVERGDDREIWFATGTTTGDLTGDTELIAPATPLWDAVQAVRGRLRR
ncbi:hypothetical protein AB0J52_17010 [Spirillospora sp. NPDC049652]